MIVSNLQNRWSGAGDEEAVVELLGQTGCRRSCPASFEEAHLAAWPACSSSRPKMLLGSAWVVARSGAGPCLGRRSDVAQARGLGRCCGPSATSAGRG